MISDEDISAEELVERWSTEEENYNYDDARWQKGKMDFHLSDYVYLNSYSVFSGNVDNSYRIQRQTVIFPRFRY